MGIPTLLRITLQQQYAKYTLKLGYLKATILNFLPTTNFPYNSKIIILIGMIQSTTRPPLTPAISEKDFRAYYWLKEELFQFCREVGLSTVGGKQEIAERIALFLRTGIKQKPHIPTSKPTPHYEELSLSTKVTESFTCTREVRDFFEAQVGPHFRFSVLLQKYIKKNPGITFADIITEYHAQEQRKKSGQLVTTIDSQFEYNQFTRSYFQDPLNKSKSRNDCIEAWKVLKSKPKV